MDLTALAGPAGHIVEVFCSCDQQLAMQRYWSRAGSRMPGHFDLERAAGELWSPETTQPVAGDWPVLTVHTDQPVDLDGLIRDLADRLRC